MFPIRYASHSIGVAEFDATRPINRVESSPRTAQTSQVAARTTHHMDQDQEHLRLLSIFHYVLGGLAGLFACLPILHVVAGIAMVSGMFPARPDQQQPPAILGWFFIGGGIFAIVAGWAFAGGMLLAGRWLAQRNATPFAW